MIDAAFRLDIPFQGRTAPVILRLAQWGQIAPMAQEPLGARAATLDQMLRTGLYNTVATVDGKPLIGPRLDAFLADAGALVPVIERRTEIYELMRSRGRLFAHCPRCKDGEVDITLLALMNTVGKMPPYIFSPDSLYFLPPATGLEWSRPRRPAGVACASQLRFRLPTRVLGLAGELPVEGQLRAFAEADEVDAWRRWETDGVNVPVGRAWWTRRHAAFRATVRLAMATRWSDHNSESTPEQFEQLAAVDVYFLDAVYWYTHLVAVPDHAPPRTCPVCAAEFLPVAALASDPPARATRGMP